MDAQAVLCLCYLHTTKQERTACHKSFSCSTHLSMEFIMLTNVQMPTIVGILTFMSLTFMSMTNTTSMKSLGFFSAF